jgi:type II secretory pathway component GspD/PulD (secretin)
MRSNKLVILFFIVFIYCYGLAKEELRSIEVEYINFNKITLNNLFGFLSKEYGINFSIEPEFRQNTISIHLQDSNLKSLLDIITRDNGMIYTQKGDIIYITPFKQNLYKRYRTNDYKKDKVSLNYASVTDTVRFLLDMMPGQAIIRSSTENKPYSNLFNANPELETPRYSGGNSGGQSDVYPETGTENFITGGEGNIAIDKNVPEDILYIIPFYNTNRVFLVSTSRTLIKEAKELIKEVDQPLKQVMIQGQILEFTVGNGFNSVFDFTTRSSKVVDTSTNPTSILGFGNIQYSFLDAKLVANMEIAKREGRASFVSSPMLLTMNRVSATLDLTEDMSIVTGVEEGSTSVNEGTTIVIPPTPIYKTEKIGTQLTITPYINNQDEILLKVDIEISSISGNTQTIVVPTSTGTTQEYSVDSISVSKINTVLTSANKKSIVFGGIIRKTVSKEEKRTPILGDIPILGIPFRTIEDSNEKRELIIILTPTIVDLKNPQKDIFINEARQKVLQSNEKKEEFYSNSDKEDNSNLVTDFREEKTVDMIDEIRQKIKSVSTQDQINSNHVETSYDNTIEEFLEQ